jgi:N-acetylglucosamine kinase-like BadF-type ATPase
MSKILTHPTSEAPTVKASAPASLKKATGSDEQYYLGIDGGGTKTHAVVTDSSFRVLGKGASGASNPLRAGLDEAVSHIEEAVAEACSQAGVRPAQITSACAAIAGVSHPIHFHTMKDALDHALGLELFELVSDARAALEGALDGRAGVVLIAGTGSIAMGINSSGEMARAGGWGPTISDEGSGYDIARRALKAVISSFDGRSAETSLTRMICDRLGIASASDLPGVLYNSDSEPVEIASLAELVARAAIEGDEVSREILREAGRELGRLVVSVIERLGLAGEAFRVACVGSVFKSGELVFEPLREVVCGVARQAVLGQPLFPPEIGAVKLAQKRLQMSGVEC